MDLRMVKTRRQIKEAFLTLRERLMPEHIKVKDICEVAMINKATFYNHYNDSAELSNEIDDSTVDKVMSDFGERDKLFDDPKAYIKGLFRSLEKEATALKRVFRGKTDVFCSKLEERLCSLYESRVEDMEEKTRLSFAIGGFVRIIKEYLLSDVKYDLDKLVDYSVKMLETLFARKEKQMAK